jgi:[acyl-carrier-protein] S-malonyltransferase
MKVAVVFPGQGSQYVGMGKDFIENYKIAMEILSEASKITGINFEKHFLNSREDGINKDIEQVTVTLIEIVMYEVIKSSLGKQEENLFLFAGHSLGEYAALYASGKVNLKETLDLVMERTRIMNSDIVSSNSGMTAITGLPIETIQKVITRMNVDKLYPSNINSYKQIVYSGEISSLEKIEKELEETAKTFRLRVSKGFHSPLMIEAKKNFQNYLTTYDFSELNRNHFEKNIISNIDGNLYESYATIINAMSNQLVRPVNWIAVVEKMIELNTTHILEVGPGRTLSGLNKNILKHNKIKSIKVLNVEEIHEIKEIILELKQ